MHVLTQEEMAFWQENGYVILRDAVPQANLGAVVDIIWEFMEMDRDDPETWYRPGNGDESKPKLKESGMAELYQHQALWDNRQHPRVYGAFADIWETEKLWVSIDRVNLNPPARADWDFPGFVHWDIDTSLVPLPNRVQGRIVAGRCSSGRRRSASRARLSSALPRMGEDAAGRSQSTCARYDRSRTEILGGECWRPCYLAQPAATWNRAQ